MLRAFSFLDDVTVIAQLSFKAELVGAFAPRWAETHKNWKISFVFSHLHKCLPRTTYIIPQTLTKENYPSKKLHHLLWQAHPWLIKGLQFSAAFSARRRSVKTENQTKNFNSVYSPYSSINPPYPHFHHLFSPLKPKQTLVCINQPFDPMYFIVSQDDILQILRGFLLNSFISCVFSFRLSSLKGVKHYCTLKDSVWSDTSIFGAKHYCIAKGWKSSKASTWRRLCFIFVTLHEPSSKTHRL